MEKSTRSNAYIADILRSIAAVYLVTNENIFKVRAYEKAADAVEQMSRELVDVYQDGKLASVAGIGPTIRGHLQEYFQHGKSKHFDEVLQLIPASVFTLMKVPGLGPKKSYRLVREFHLDNEDTVLDELAQLAQSGKIAPLDGFGEKSQSDISGSIAAYQNRPKGPARLPMPHALQIADAVVAYLSQIPLTRIDVLGSLRRMAPTIGDIDIAVSADSKNEPLVIPHFLKYPQISTVAGAGDKKASIILFSGVKVDLRMQDTAQYGSMLQYFTGSKAHNVKLREYANKKGLSLSEWGIKKVASSKLKVTSNRSAENNIISFQDEGEFYKYIGLDWIPPEIREGTDEIEHAGAGKLPNLIRLADIRGDLHVHSNYDLASSHDVGTHSYAELAAEAARLNYEYIGFTDHNPKSTLTDTEICEILKKRQNRIKTDMKHSPIRYFIGLEVDIKPDGSLALPESAYRFVDYLIVSIHSSFSQDRDTCTKRVLSALAMPKVRIFGHPTGRLIGKREGVDLDWDPIMKAMKKNNQVFEINASPDRLDLPETLVRDAVTHGVQCCINTDAHDAAHMSGMKYGVAVARRGWASAHDIINTRNAVSFANWLTNY